jgi:hypothetical protein
MSVVWIASFRVLCVVRVTPVPVRRKDDFGVQRDERDTGILPRDLPVTVLVLAPRVGKLRCGPWLRKGRK